MDMELIVEGALLSRERVEPLVTKPNGLTPIFISPRRTTTLES